MRIGIIRIEMRTVSNLRLCCALDEQTVAGQIANDNSIIGGALKTKLDALKTEVLELTNQNIQIISEIVHPSSYVSIQTISYAVSAIALFLSIFAMIRSKK